MDRLIFRKAVPEDLDRIVLIIKGAKERMRDAGRTQWQGAYPGISDIKKDIESGYGYVAVFPGQAEAGCGQDVEGVIAGYCAVVLSGEPAYDHLEGRWLSEDRYVVVHRMAVNGTMLGRGVSKMMFSAVSELALSNGVRSFKVDTNYDNVQMNHILKSLGFSECGTIRYADGPRIAYEKILGV
mgnify:FL=1